MKLTSKTRPEFSGFPLHHSRFAEGNQGCFNSAQQSFDGETTLLIALQQLTFMFISFSKRSSISSFPSYAYDLDDGVKVIFME